MNDIEKLSEKLRNHTVAPPPAAWQTLAQGLHQKRRKKRVAYWWVAAAVMLLGVAITWIGLENQNLVPRVAQQVITDSVTVSKEILVVDNQVVTKDFDVDTAILTLKKIYKTHRHSGAVPRRDRHPGSYHSDSAPAPGGDSYPESPATKSQTGNFTDVKHGTKEGDSGSFASPGADALRYANVRTASTPGRRAVDDGKMRIANIDSKGGLKSVTETSNQYPSTVSEVSDVEPSLLSDELSIKILSPSPLAAGKKETRVIEKVKAVSEQSTARQPTLVVEASRYRKSAPKTDTFQVEEEVVTRGSAVTVIYQPNPATLAEKPSLGQKINRTLTFLEEHGIGYSELRSAKSDLVDKLFSGKELQREGPY